MHGPPPRLSELWVGWKMMGYGGGGGIFYCLSGLFPNRLSCFSFDNFRYLTTVIRLTICQFSVTSFPNILPF
jgi:hypothetical protein